MELPRIQNSSYGYANYPIIGNQLNQNIGCDAQLSYQQMAAGQLKQKRRSIDRDRNGGLITTEEEGKKMATEAKTRIVRVYIADPDDKVPVEKRLLYSGEEKLTEDTNQELFYSVPIAQLLLEHNQKRTAILDKKASEKSGRDVFLEAVKIRDLVMTVVEIAVF